MGLLVGAKVDGWTLGNIDFVGGEVGFVDFVGFKVGTLDAVGDTEGKAVGATPHWTVSVHGTHTSMFCNRIFKLSGLDDLNPPIH